MKVYHNSQDIRFRSPFGAVKTGDIVTLRIDISGCDLPESVMVRVWTDDGEKLYPMTATKKIEVYSYSAKIEMPEVPCLLWYCFVINMSHNTYWYLNASDGLGGVGRLENFNDGKSYQITVYDKAFKTPEWFCGKVMYQIFPDRFYGEHKDREIHKKREEYIVHYDKYEPKSFNRHPYESGPACNDFYGGNLKGIIKKLPYIKSLGVGVIYLNPIFDAYSNHKYDTANYKEIDSMFGTEEDFSELCKKADEYGIKIILDGVCSHTGADSIYFNKYGNYGEGGAYNDENSPYRSWYKINDNKEYESWWGCSNLPNVDELEPSYLDYILRDDDSVIKRWLRLGASGWRLDVADELPDEFIQILREEVKKVKEDAVIIGEVWEDASNKIAYSMQREYLLGYELDSVMNYPFKDNVTAFISGQESAEEMDRALMSIAENYPVCVRYSLMNLIGTHDTMRIKSYFGGLESECGEQKLSSGLEELATYRLKCAMFIQMTYVGVPSIYYGDEAGMQGGRDPYNRKPFPWHSVDMDLIETVRALGKLRNECEVLQTGLYKTLYAKDGVYVYARYFENGKNAFGEKAEKCLAICAVNRDFEERIVELDLSDFEHSKLYKGIGVQEAVSEKMGHIEIKIQPVGFEFITDKKL